MNRLNKILFSLIGPVVSGEPRGRSAERFSAQSLADEEALAAVFALAKRHDLSHLLAGAVREMRNEESRNGTAGYTLASPEKTNTEGEARNAEGINAELLADISRAEYTAIFRVKNIINEQGRVRKCFEDAGIPFILLKGSVTRGFYPAPWMRTSSDIDVLVPRERLQETVKLITGALDYRVSTLEPNDASLFARSGVHLDVHTLIEGDTEDCRLLTRVWASARSEGGCERFMTGEIFYFHHVSHMAKHMRNGGCGIRPFIDLYLIEKNVTYDRAAVAELLCEFGLDRFESAAMRLCKAWMTGGEADDLAVMEEYVLTGGVYGSCDQYVAARQRGRRGKLHYILRRIFMPYDEIRRRYKILEKHRWLTPLFEVLRWFSLLDPKRLKRTKKELDSTARLDSERIASVRTLLESLGL